MGKLSKEPMFSRAKRPRIYRFNAWDRALTGVVVGAADILAGATSVLTLGNVYCNAGMRAAVWQVRRDLERWRVQQAEHQAAEDAANRKLAEEPELRVPVMPRINGARVYCPKCGVGVFTKTAVDRLVCNGCGAEFESVSAS